MKRIHKEYPRLKIMAVTTYNDMGFLTQMIKNGANGYLLKSANIEDIQDAIKVVMSGGTYIDRQLGTVDSDFMSSKVNKNVPFITSREKEVLELISKGMKNQEIANQLLLASQQ
ncbi:MAG: response regulator transcription factor [Saprospiraceae bacterium]|nr:response regulator transcription factor [Saprospiraceae bacterium]